MTGLTEGEHTLLISAADVDGNTSESTVTFTIDLTDPTIALDPIGLDGIVGTDLVIVSGIVTDEFLIGDTILYSLDGADAVSTSVVVDTNGLIGAIAIDVAGFVPGDHELSVTGFDKAGNTVEQVVSFTFDATPPSMDVVIGNSGYTNQTAPTLAGTANDDFGLSDSVLYSLDGAASLAAPLERDSAGIAGTFTIATAGLSEGQHTVEVTATDRVGNVANGAFTFFVDLTVPALPLDPIGNQGFLSALPITGTLTDERRLASSLQYAFDGGGAIDLPLSLDGAGTSAIFSIPTIALPDGEHTITLLGQDQAGNTVEQSATFIIDTVGPQPAQITPDGTDIGEHRELVIVLGEDQIVAAPVTDPTNWALQASGGDAVFGDADAFEVPLLGGQIAYDEATRTVTITLPAPLVEDFYRLTIKGSGPAVIHDLAGNPLNDGADFVHGFVILDLPAVAREPDKALETGGQPIDLVVVDLDGNGLDDLVVVDQLTGALTVAMNDGGSDWQSVNTVDLGLGPIHGLTAGDFNEDTKPDLLLQGLTNVFLAIGDGTGLFALAQTLAPAGLAEPPSQGRIGLLAADGTGDGHLDAVILVPETNEVLVFAGDGTGALAAPQAISTGGEGPVDLALGDYVGDGSLDLAIGHHTSGSVTFLEGDGGGGFVLNSDFTVLGLGPISALETADFNSDGRQDLAVAAGTEVFVLINTPGLIEIIPLANGDFVDGLAEWSFETSQLVASAGTVEVIDGAAVFQEGAAGRVTLSQQLVIPAGATVLSFDLVGNSLETALAGKLPDAFEVSLLAPAGQSLLPAIGTSLTAYLNFGPTGEALLGAGVSITGNRVTLDLSPITVDTEATLYLDLVTSGPGTGSTVSVDNFAVLVPPVITHDFISGGLAGPFGAAKSIVAGDVDGDERTDLLVTDATGKVVVYSGDAHGGFARTELDPTGFGTGPMALAVGNFTDGTSDEIAYSLLDSGLVVTPLGVLPDSVDVTDGVTIEYFSTQLDRSTNTFTFFGTVTNTSSEPLNGPIVLTWADLGPGAVNVINADGALVDGTPFFDLTDFTGDGVLDPGETTSARIFHTLDPLLEVYSFRSVVTAVVIADGAAGSTVQVSTANPSFDLSATEIEVGSTIAASIEDGPGVSGDWVGLFTLGTADYEYLDWSYLDRSRSEPAAAQTSGNVVFVAPQKSGLYELRFFSDNSYARLAISERFAVSGGDTDRPTAPQVTGFGIDTGLFSDDRLTRDTTPRFTWSQSNDSSGVLGYWWAIDDENPEINGTFTEGLSTTPIVASEGPHVFYVRAVDASPNANLSTLGSFAFEIDTQAPIVESIAPAEGNFLASGPGAIVVRFSESVFGSAGELIASHLVLSGAGVGEASVTDAVWVDDRTARFVIGGAWGTGLVAMELQGAAIEDVAGNPFGGYVSHFTVEESVATTLDISASQLNAGALITLTLRNGPGNPDDRIGIYEVGSLDENPIDWLYLNGTKDLPNVGVTGAQWTVTSPLASGQYEFRLLSSGTEAAVSPVFVVTGVEIFLDFDGGYLPDLVGVLEVDGSTGLIHDGFVPYGGEDREIQIARILDLIMVDFAAYAVEIIRDDNWQHNPRFDSEDTVILVGGDGTWFAADNPTVTGTSVRWVSGVAPWDRGNTAANVGFAFSDATAEAFRTLGWATSQFVQHVANTTSHEIGHTFGLDHVTSLNGTAELMGTAETGTQVSGDGEFAELVLPRQHGGAASSHTELLGLFGGAASESEITFVSTASATSSSGETLEDAGDAAVLEAEEATASETQSSTLPGVVNGSFDVGMPTDSGFGWTTLGSGAVIGGVATLNEGGPFMTRFSQTLVIPDADLLQFTITGASFFPNGPLPPDAFEVALLAGGTSTSLVNTAGGLSNTDAFFNLQQTGQLYFGQEVDVFRVVASGETAGLTFPLTVNLDLRGIATGTVATLYFDLLGFGPATSSVTIDDVRFNNLPVADAGGIYSIDEGQTLLLDGSGSSDADEDPLTYSWDLNGDGTFSDAIGAQPNITWAQLQGLGIIDDGSYTVTVRVDDGRGGVTEASADLSVSNTAPSASLGNGGAVDEGSTGSVSFASQFDPSNADTEAGFTYSYDFDNDGTFEITASNSSSTTVPATYLDDGLGSRTVKGRIIDKDGGFTDYTTVITINNVDPTATFDNGGAVDEGSMGTVSFSSQSDPSSADTISGFQYSYDFDNDGTFEIVDSTSSSATVPASYLDDGPDSRTIKGRIIDKDGGSTDYTTVITIIKFDPTPTLAKACEVVDGSTGTVSFSSQFDPSSADTIAGFHYSYDFDSDGTFEIVDSTSSSATVPATYLDDGPGSRTVNARITDKNGGFTDYTTVITINNVAPTATFDNGGAVNEGSAGTVSLSNQFDPSMADSSAGFHYSYDFDDDGTFEIAASTDTSVTIPASFLDDGPGSRTIRARIEDKNNGFTDYTTVISIINLNPTATFANGGAVDEGTTGTVFFSNPSDPSNADSNAGFTYSFDFDNDGTFEINDITSEIAVVPADYLADGPGSRTVRGRIKDKDGASSDYTTEITIDNVAPSVGISGAAQTVQYSDPILDVTVSGTDVAGDMLSASTSFNVGGGEFVTGLPDGLSFVGSGGAGFATWTISGIADVAPEEYVIRVSVADEDGGTTTTDIPLEVLREDSTVTYSGVQFMSTASVKTSEATLTLRATVRDITAVDPDSDDDPGDVRNATVTFVNRDTGAIIASGLPVTLLDANDPKTGVATFDWLYDLGNNDSESIAVGMIVDGYYKRNTSDDDTVVTISKPLSDFITGGGYIINSDSAGTYAGADGARTNFGFNVKYNPSLTNLRGRVNIILRNAGRIYQIKTNAMNSLSVNPVTGEATFTSKANLRDITDPDNPISMGGNLSLEMTLTDRGEPGSFDSIGFAVWDKGTLLFSSNWDGTNTIEQNLAGGNVVVHTQSQALHASHAPTHDMREVARIDEHSPQQVTATAVDYWRSAGISADQLSSLAEVEFHIADLPGTFLGLAHPSGAIWLDDDAGGFGWATQVGQQVRGDQRTGRIDLVSVVTHEFGHLLGFDHDDHDHDVMSAVLSPGSAWVTQSSTASQAATKTARESVVDAVFGALSSHPLHEFDRHATTSRSFGPLTALALVDDEVLDAVPLGDAAHDAQRPLLQDRAEETSSALSDLELAGSLPDSEDLERLEALWLDEEFLESIARMR